MNFTNKAQTLLYLKKKFSNNIPRLEIFTYNEFKNNPNKVIKKIQKKFKGLVAIRSSYKDEDSKIKSNAGKYISTLNINIKSSDKLKKSIKLTLDSYKKRANSKFFVQKMIRDVKISGVCLTKSLNGSFPSFEINYTEGNQTDKVTSGKSNIKNLIFIPNNKYQVKNKNFLNLINFILRLIKIFKNDSLDIEFAINKKNRIFILQVRPLIVKKRYLNIKITNKVLNKISKKILKLQTRHFHLFGKTTYFGVMPDWNPAEIIGIKPKPLALSIYQELITNSVWSKNRFKCGFQDVETNHLMTTFYGTPYIDIRIDFNSWIPQNLKSKTKNKLVNFYLNEFRKNKKSHDKVEFDILFTCFTSEIKKIIKKKLNSIFTKKEINNLISELKKITNSLIVNYDKEILLIEKLKEKQKIVQESNLYPLEKVYWLIEDCKKFGTDPFASLARCAFVSIQLINSLVEQNIISNKEKYEFLSSINSVTSNIIKDFNNLKKNEFLKIYGHLRPNTYDITSPNYKEGYSKFFQRSKSKNIRSNKFKFKDKQIHKIKNYLKKIGIKLTVYQFINFLKSSIDQREYAKFIFTRSIDMVFENLKSFGKRFDISINDLSYLKIQKILELHYNLDGSDLKKLFKNEIKLNKKEFNFNKDIKLPEVITSTKDLYINFEMENKTNFVTTKKTHSEIVILKNFNENINGKIAIIENADPGYDYIFSKKVNGLVTKYGGVNSHMAIRCAELSIPAAIGVGEILYEKIIKKKYITLDCESKKIN